MNENSLMSISYNHVYHNLYKYKMHREAYYVHLVLDALYRMGTRWFSVNTFLLASALLRLQDTKFVSVSCPM